MYKPEQFMSNMEGARNVQFFHVVDKPEQIYVTFSKDGEDYFVGMNKDLDKHNISLLDRSLNEELIQKLEESPAPENAREVVGLITGEITHQKELDSGQDTNQYS